MRRENWGVGLSCELARRDGPAVSEGWKAIVVSPQENGDCPSVPCPLAPSAPELGLCAVQVSDRRKVARTLAASTPYRIDLGESGKIGTLRQSGFTVEFAARPSCADDFDCKPRCKARRAQRLLVFGLLNR